MDRDRSLDIAVTGLSGRFPGSPDIAGLWSALTAGRVLTTRYEPGDLQAAGVPRDLLESPDYVSVGGHLAGADRFDNAFFRVSPRDAEMMDPQHRLMLEAAWAALEDAGTGLGGSPTTAVYASGSGSAYLRAMLSGGRLDPADLEQALHGTEPDFIASLISYKLGLTGPAIAVQTACSSGLVAVHVASQALLNGDCDQAVVVAAGIDYPQAGHLHIHGGIQSGSGNCRPFDESADGVVAGSGVACVVLRRFADAIEDGPEPYGVILGSAINNDGPAKAGYYAPSAIGQEAVIRAALRAADVDACSIGYLEAHATGTRVGDPIEWSAASSALRGMGASRGQVAVGALKANIGHLDAAAGLASLIKVLLVVKEGVVPPVAGFTRLNPLLEAESSPLYVPTEAEAWAGPLPRRAGISAFGIGGTNAHVIIEQAPASAAARPTGKGSGSLVMLSAADPEALARSAARLSDRLAREATDLVDVAYTLAVGRAELSERLIVCGRDSADVVDSLVTGAGVIRGQRPADGPAPIAFAFPGQGSQYPGMAIPFVEALPGFTAALEACLDAFDPLLSARLRRALLDADFPAEELDATELAQPALFAVEHAAASALTALGVTPSVLVGHSLGEITAACVAGVLDLASAARFVTKRGRAMQACRPGAMLALGCDETLARDLVADFGGGLEIAAVNTPETCVVAGAIDAVEAFRARLGDSVFAKRLRSVRAFHSALIEPAVPVVQAAFDGTRLRRSVLPFAANTTGQIIPAGTDVGADMFVAQIRRPVRFAAGIAAIAEHFPGVVVVEIGPGRVLSAMADAVGLTAIALSPARTAHADDEVRGALGTLWTLGQPIRPVALCGEGRRVHLPGYPFAGPRWIAAEAAPRPPQRSTTQGVVATPTTVPAADGSPVRDISPAQVPALLAGLWADLLGHAEVTEDSDFFELGGDSLLITNLARKVNQRLGVKVPIRALLAGRTLGRQTTTVLEVLTPPVALRADRP